MQTNSDLRPVTPTSIVSNEIEILTETFLASGWSETAERQLSRISAIAKGLDPYIEFCTTPHSDDLHALLEATNSKDWHSLHDGGNTVHELESEMLSGHVEGQFLKFLISISNATNILEIGMFTGYATLAMAEAIPETGKVIACELDPFTADFARSFFERTSQNDKIDVRVGSAHDEIKKLAEDGQKFDLVFIDAEKSGYIAYLEAILNLDLLGNNGFVVVDNTLMQGQTYCGASTANGDSIREFNEYVRLEPRVEQVLVPLRDGLTLIRRVDAKGGSNE